MPETGVFGGVDKVRPSKSKLERKIINSQRWARKSFCLDHKASNFGDHSAIANPEISEGFQAAS